MLYDEVKKRHSLATLLTFTVGSGEAVLSAGHPVPGQPPLRESILLSRPVCRREGVAMVPVELFRKGLFAYVTAEEKSVTVEHSGRMVCLPLDGVHAYDDNGVVMADAGYVLSRFNVDWQWLGDTCQVITEAKNNGPRKLTPAEERLPYAKYYRQYWETPYHLRADFISWSKKAGLYAGNNMQPPEKMLHIKDVNRLMDRAYRENEWHEGWTLFDDGSGVMCARTEFPGTTAEMFQWWFAWHVLEDLRYMLWCPPSHYGIAPALELRRRVEDPSLSLTEKTHGAAVHHVYESTTIDALSYPCAAPVDYFDIPFFDPQYRGFTDENTARLQQQGCAAICGSDRMLHFFAENEDGTGGVCYTHFWFGTRRDEQGKWVGVKEGKNYDLMIPLMTIAQHANKEFPLLAGILPQLYAEEGGKPLASYLNP